VPCAAADSMIALASSTRSGSTRLLPNLLALGEQEGVGHAAADDQDVDLVDQVPENLDLSGDLGAADDRGEGSFGVLHELCRGTRSPRSISKPRVRRQEMSDPLGAGHGHDGRSRTHRSRRRRRSWPAPWRTPGRSSLFGVEAEVLEEDALARLEALESRPRCRRRARRPSPGPASLSSCESRSATGRSRMLS